MALCWRQYVGSHGINCGGAKLKIHNEVNWNIFLLQIIFYWNKKSKTCNILAKQHSKESIMEWHEQKQIFKVGRVMVSGLHLLATSRYGGIFTIQQNIDAGLAD